MGKECTRGLLSDYKSFTGKLDSLKRYFPQFTVVDTFNKLTNVKSKGVYVFKDGDVINIRIFGGCPNFTNGSCSLTNCISGMVS